MELDGIAGPRQLAMSQDEEGLSPYAHPQPFGVKTQGGLIRARSHDVAVDRLEERLDESWVHGLPACEFV